MFQEPALLAEGWFRRFLDRLSFSAMKRLLRRLGIAAGIALASLLAAPTTASAGGSAPNIVFIFADDMGIGDAGVYGQADILTPNIDALAGSGMRFTDMYCPAAVCTPSRCGLMTGYHMGHGTADRNLGVNGSDFPLRAEDITVAEVLKSAGYDTGFVGKWGMGPGTNETNPSLVASSIDTLPTRQGFDYMYGYLNQSRAHSYEVPSLWQSDPSAPDGVSLSPTNGTYTHDLITGKAEQFIADRAGGDAPFYLQASFTPPHWDIDAVPQEWKDIYAGKGWEDKKVNLAAMITHLDASVGDLIARIEDPNGDGDTSDSVASNTIIIFASDNGPAKEDGGDPAFFDSNGDYKGYKRDLFDGGIRTPFIVRWDGVIAAGSTNNFVGSLIDFLPTAAELAGVDAPVGIDGISLAPTLTGEGAQKVHDFLIWEAHEANGGVSGANAPRWAIRQDDWKLIKMEDGTYRLYDLASDPGETANVVSANPDLKNRLETIALLEKVEAPLNYAVQHRDWQGAAGGSWTVDANWSGDGAPDDSWVATLDNASGGETHTEVDASVKVLAFQVSGSAGEMHVDVRNNAVLTARNGVRIACGGVVNLKNASLETVREVDVRHGGALVGSGTVTGDVYNAGRLAPGQIHGTPSEPAVNTGVVTALTFDFTGVQDDAPLTAASTLNENLMITHGLDFGAGVGPRHPDGGSTDRGDEFNVSGFGAVDLAAAIAADDYLTFSVSPVAGVAMTLDSVSFNLWRNGVNAGTNYAILTGIDGFADGSELGTISISTTGIDNQVLFTADYTGGTQVTGPLEIRLYGWGGATETSNTHVNGVSLDASFLSLPGQALGPAGLLTLDGDYEQTADGELEIDLGGMLPGEYDRLVVNGLATLNGKLSVSFLDGLDELLDGTEEFLILSAEGLSGEFDNALDGGRLYTTDGLGSFLVTYGTDSVILSDFAAVPEPATVILLVLGGAGLLRRKRR